VPKAEATPCNDRNPLTYRDMCIDGRCVGHQFLEPKFQTRGTGDCVVHEPDSQTEPIARYYMDATEPETCRTQCAYDPECQAYSFGFHVCSIYGTARSRDPEGGWKLERTAAYIMHDVVCYAKTQGEVWDFVTIIREWLYSCTLAVIVTIPTIFTLVWFRNDIRSSRRRMDGVVDGVPCDDLVFADDEEPPKSPKGSAAIAQNIIYERPDEEEEDGGAGGNPQHAFSDAEDAVAEAPSPAGPGPAANEEMQDPRGQVFVAAGDAGDAGDAGEADVAAPADPKLPT